MADEIIELLKNEKLHTKVIRGIGAVYDAAYCASHDEWMDKLPDPLKDKVKDVMRPVRDITQKVDDDLRARGEPTLDEKWPPWEQALFDEGPLIERAFQEHVIERMSWPARITLADIADGFVLLAKPPECTSQVPDWESIYAVLLNYVENHLLSRKRLPGFEVCRSPTEGPSMDAFCLGLRAARSADEGALAKLAEELSAFGENGESAMSAESEKLLRLLPKVFEQLFCWSSANGITVRFSWGRAAGRWRHVVAEVEGCMSAAASELLQSEMTHLLKSIVKSLSLVEPCADAWEPGEPFSGGLPALDESTLSDQELFVRSCLDAFCSKPAPKPKDSIDKRIRNAVQLLMASDAQSNDALGLALSVTAMEALLGRGNTEISERLSTDVAVLLEPELDRRSEATKFVKRLYNLRSEALHGKSLEKDEHEREQARLLAAGILRGMVTRRDFMRKLRDEPETPEDLLKELRNMQYRPGQILDVNEPSVRELWGVTRTDETGETSMDAPT